MFLSDERDDQVSDPASWIAETFSQKSKDEDIVKARSLNTTRIAGVVTPVLAGVWTAISEFSDKSPFNQTGFQKQLILALIGLVAIVSTADIIGRSVAVTKMAAPVPVATPLPIALKASKNNPTGPDPTGRVVAFRASNALSPASSGEYLFVPMDGQVGASWELASVITLSPAQ